MDEKREVRPDSELADLVSRVERGETVELTRHGRLVARIVGTQRSVDAAEASRAMDRILALGSRTSLGGLRLKDLTHDGHRF